MSSTESSSAVIGLFTLNLVGTIFLIEITLISSFSQVFNYPTIISLDNALRQYTNETNFIRYLKLFTVFIIRFIAFKTIQKANGKANAIESSSH